ncbi:hypothetical protein EUGRSUZ_H02714 [Eucalyptus grandis]|uniref:Uncharacterized protein n=2 Tax=Eucalyptus grandis TaxID=71139 RepID=A0A059B190_EUCGR|nr:hypothetical protein EUGRSUZ_H02714 [Eucalyptus grandis]
MFHSFAPLCTRLDNIILVGKLSNLFLVLSYFPYSSFSLHGHCHNLHSPVVKPLVPDQKKKKNRLYT